MMLPGTDTLLGPTPPESEYLEAYRQLRASLLSLHERVPFRSLMVTSAKASEGKSTVVLNLGTAMAFASRPTVCVDLDLHHPQLHELVGVPMVPGFTDVLAGEATLAQCLQTTGIDGLSFIAAGSRAGGRADILAASSPLGVLTELGEQCDFIIIDSTPVLDFAVSLELARVVEMCVVVARARRPAAPVVQAVEMLENAGATVAGIIVNDVLPEDRIGASAGYYEEGLP